MRKLDILAGDIRGGRYRWYAVDMASRQRTNEGCCSISRRSSQCDGFKTEKLAKHASDENLAW
jgi:hypothetical protein